MMVTVSSASDWTQFQKDSYNSGLTCDRAPVDTPSVISWNCQVPSAGAVDCSPTVVDDTLYIVVPGGNVSAIDKTAGTVTWDTNIGVTGYQLGTPAYGNGTLFVPREDGRMYALDGQSGDVLWVADVSENWLYTPVVYDEHYLYFGDCSDFEGNGGNFYCYSDMGEEIWARASSSGGGYYWAGSAIVGDFVVFVDSRGYLSSLEKDTGYLQDEVNVSELFSLADAGEFKSSVSYSPDTGKLFFTSKGGYCYSLGFYDNGSFDVSDNYCTELYRGSSSTPSVFNGRVYVGCGDWSTGGRLYCLDESDLSEIWNFTANAGIKASPVISRAYDEGDGEVYIYFTSNCLQGTVYCLKDYPGNSEVIEMWSYEPSSGKNEHILQGVAISDGWLFFGNDGGYLFGLATSQSVKAQHVFADFETNISSGDYPLTVEFIDKSVDADSWSWDVDGDGVVDYTERNPVHTYDELGSYNVSLTAGNSVFTHTRMVKDCIAVDWNPWNDLESEYGDLISYDEVLDAVFYWKYGLPVPGTAERVLSFDEILDIVFYWKYSCPM
jgi:outer membrane protein assembly factor BamB